MDCDDDRIARNIRALRKAMGETQEELGVALGVEKNTISYYETGERSVNKEILIKLSDHFMVSPDELLSYDFSKMKDISFDYDIVWKNIDIFLPIVSTSMALINKHFKRAYNIHLRFFDELKQKRMNSIDRIDSCLEEYSKAYEETSCMEAVVNIIGIYDVLLFIIKSFINAMNVKPAPLLKLMRNEPEKLRGIEDIDKDALDELQEVVKDIDNDEMRSQLRRYKCQLKTSEWSDILYYYIALEYLWSTVNNEYSFTVNSMIGDEMMTSLLEIENPYAIKFYDIIKTQFQI